jgi:glycerophosphoryl diester phosphodiesterase
LLALVTTLPLSAPSQVPAPVPASAAADDARRASLVLTPAVAGHRGASGYRPEHTLEAFRLALASGDDDLELDLVPTRDGHLVVRHDAELSVTTDVADRPELAHLRRVQEVDGARVAGWFVEDLTLAQVRSLRARERMVLLRPGSAAYDGRFPVATLEDVLALVSDWRAATGRDAGLLLELKHVAHFRRAGLALDELVLDALCRHGLDHGRARVTVMAFEEEPLRWLADRARVPLVRLVDRPEQATPAALATVAEYADGIGAGKHLLLDGSGERVVRDAHRHWLTVRAWTLAAENRFLAPAFRTPAGVHRAGDLAGEAGHLLALGVDGLITDHPDLVLAARDRWVGQASGTSTQATR